MKTICAHRTSMPSTLYGRLLCVWILCAGALFYSAEAADSTGRTSKKLALPPMVDGGIAGFPRAHHTWLEERFGEYRLCTHENTPYAADKARDADAWELVEMGRFTPDGTLRFATLARIANRDDGVLLIIFSWGDTATEVGPLTYYNFLGEDEVLLHTAQGVGETVDTLLYTCKKAPDTWCGRVYYSETQKDFVIRPNPAIVDSSTDGP
jgi:hypothetical protein